MHPPLHPLLLSTTFSLLASRPVASVGASGESLYNPEAVVPPQCYTKHEGKHNPCYVCHQSHQGEPRLNAMNDVRLQSEYDFAEEAFHNHWTNLFVDRSERIAAISDREILAYVAEDNVTPLAARLDEQGWPGYVPRMQDLDKASDAFDEAGFARDGSGWVAFNYKPLPSTFWPTNGSIDDVFVRLPPRFQKNADGEPDRRIYQLNLSALEAAIKDLDSLSIPTTDETALGRDLQYSPTVPVPCCGPGSERARSPDGQQDDQPRRRGQAPSDDPGFAAFLVRAGFDSVSVNPDSFLLVKQAVAEIDRTGAD